MVAGVDGVPEAFGVAGEVEEVACPASGVVPSVGAGVDEGAEREPPRRLKVIPENLPAEVGTVTVALRDFVDEVGRDMGTKVAPPSDLDSIGRSII